MSRPGTSHRYVTRPGTSRPRSAVSTLGVENQEIICAVSESRGISPVVGISFLNLDTGEAVMSQINDSQTFVRTVHKLAVFNPSIVLIVSSAAESKSKLFSILQDSLNDIEGDIVLLDRRYWAESTGLEYLEKLAFREDLEALKTAVSGNYYAVCCFGAVLRYIELGLCKTFPYHSLRIKYEPAEGCMMIDVATIRALELVQNLTHIKSRECLFGLLNETLTPMGARLLRSSVLQPLTNAETLAARYETVEELGTKEEMFLAVRTALKPFLDVDRTLTQLILIPTQSSLLSTEQAINQVLMLKQYISLIRPVYDATMGTTASLLKEIHLLCAPKNILPTQTLVNEVLNTDATFASKSLELRNQRTYAVKSGVNGMLDIARQTYKETMGDAMRYISDLADEHDLALQTKFDNARRFYMRIGREDLEARTLPTVFVNVFRKKEWIECQTLELLKLNQRMSDSHSEAISMSDKSIQELIVKVREHIAPLFKICEGVAMLDMLASFAQLASTHGYTRPQLNATLALKTSKHPIRAKMQGTQHVPNDVYATQQKRFHIVTGCNMSGKSTYIRSIALITIMAQVGSFVPADFASIAVRHQLLARVSTDDSIEANVSTFAAEMREAAFILNNVDRESMVIVDELGRGTSTRDGLAIAIAIAEALIESRALV
ncbi:hypothetical protein AMS68_002186 [Peltaster fructicola]|uniref:DNA mismatch repair proteins mutS family domain-containing protein n=1 Tax=Peltaster fructicola TaxID=286661 RepID=A0A6H0XPX0_9PEZI|nr:hypothetical protein AMS68_002186 [Peltaster fructicola]